MACEIQKVSVVVALANAVASTPGVAFGAVAPPLEPALALRMWLSWAGLLVALGFLSKCLEDNGRQEEAEAVKREVGRLRQELDTLKQRTQ
ncbi:MULTISPECIES: hypothetical protein [unclassified Mesorhizobium]|uniref:hypothetical protein n=1 Tax=unclassified Mesorhizobium TaxID=325217 RepID=UPI000FD8600A|nr:MULTISPECIES: hypothetical protein [unclassified Mesorhizobium]TGT77950.1 hypothetical protein EN809_010470 [Mesorhizobium sp. M2E.F.Ca.ET.166.01.1.1]TGW04060.1 hypothetical protein EN797_010470 [Mesorhizobium sp. M2E.F.Ca.ET.154.01.1.1]